VTPEFVYKDGVRHYSNDAQHRVYSFGPNRNIYVTAEGYRFEDNSGNWSTYGLQGRLTAYGDRNGVQVSLVYGQGDAGKPLGILDDSGQQALWYEYDAQGNLSRVRDAYGRSVGYEYTQDGKLSKITDVLGYETCYFYDETGKLSSKTDPAGDTTHIEYDEFDHVKTTWKGGGFRKDFVYGYDEARQEYYTRVTYKGGKIEETWFDAEGRRIRKDINGRTAERAVFDQRRKVLMDAAGHQTFMTYDEWHNLIEKVYPDNSRETFAYLYSPKGFVVTTKVDRQGIVINYEYDENGNLIRLAEAAGTDAERTTEFAYSESGYLLSARVLGDAGTIESITGYAYDASGNMLSMTDPEGNTTRFTHDHMGNVLTRQDPRGNTWQYEYDVKGRLISISDPAGGTTQRYYDARNNLIREIDPAGREKTFAYNLEGRLISSTDALGNTTGYDYDADGRLVRTVNPEGGVTENMYDADGRLSTTIDSAGISTSTAYDESDQSGCSNCFGAEGKRLSAMMYPTFAREYEYDSLGRKTLERDILSDTLSYTTRYEYDASGNVTVITDKEDRITRKEYDELGRLKRVIDAKGGITSFTYDDRGNLITLTDPNGNTTWFEYDRNNKVTKETRPMGQETIYAYDAAGNLIRKTDAQGQVTEHEYDNVGRVIQTGYFWAADLTAPVKTVSYTYDAVGNLLSYEDGTTSAQYVYDALNRKISETVDYGTFSLSYSYTYTPNGQKESFTGPDGIEYEYTYDAGGRIKSIGIPGQGFITYNDYTWNRPATMSLPGGTVKEYTYDPLMRYTGMRSDAPDDSAVMDYSYAHDGMDNILSKDTEHGSYAYTYDDIYQLTDAANPGTEDEAYTYDGAGNRMTSADIQGTWTYNRNNELIGYADISFEYDANGNMVKRIQGSEEMNYLYDVENRLIRVENGAGAVIAHYYYDPFGRRLWKEVSGIRTHFFYSEEGLIGEYTSLGAQIKAYGYRPNSLWTTDPLFMKQGGQIYLFHNDHLGTPQQITDMGGAVVWSARYDSFGKAELDVVSTITNNLRFPGQYYDEESGLHYNLNRNYSPDIGRYLSVDPIGLESNDYNGYRYCINNSIKMIDELGLEGVLTIYSSGYHDGSSGSGGLSGHSWLSFTPYEYNNVTTTYGTWGNNPYGLGNGLHFNLELNRDADVSRSILLTDEEEALFYVQIDRYKRMGEEAWSLTSPCSSFSSDVWNTVTRENLNPYGPYSNPSSLENSILKANDGVREFCKIRY